MLSSCGLKRSNPLDPNGNPDVVAPDAVMNATASPSSGSASPSITIRWSANNPENTSGYYIYRGLGFFSSFTLVGSVDLAENTQFVHTESVFRNIQYFYKVSAYKTYPGGKLEGAKSIANPYPVIIRQ
jgi:hypothetical protein